MFFWANVSESRVEFKADSEFSSMSCMEVSSQSFYCWLVNCECREGKQGFAGEHLQEGGAEGGGAGKGDAGGGVRLKRQKYVSCLIAGVHLHQSFF